MPSAVSTSVNDLPVDSEIVCAPLEYEPFAIAIRAAPFVTATSRKSGFALGKLLPSRTISTRPLTEILAVPVVARVRAAVVCAWVGAVELEPEDPEPVAVEAPAVPVDSSRRGYFQRWVAQLAYGKKVNNVLVSVPKTDTAALGNQWGNARIHVEHER